MIKASRYVDSLAVALGGLVFELVGRVVDPKPLAAEHEIVDAVTNLGR